VWCARLGLQNRGSSKINIVNKKVDFVLSTYFKLLKKIKGISKNNCDFFS